MTLPSTLLPLPPGDLRPCKRCGREGLAWVPVGASRFRLVYTREVRGVLCALPRYRHGCEDGAAVACPDARCEGLTIEEVRGCWVCRDCRHQGLEAPIPAPGTSAAETAALVADLLGGQ